MGDQEFDILFPQAENHGQDKRDAEDCEHLVIGRTSCAETRRFYPKVLPSRVLPGGPCSAPSPFCIPVRARARGDKKRMVLLCDFRWTFRHCDCWSVSARSVQTCMVVRLDAVQGQSHRTRGIIKTPLSQWAGKWLTRISPRHRLLRAFKLPAHAQ